MEIRFRERITIIRSSDAGKENLDLIGYKIVISE